MKSKRPSSNARPPAAWSLITAAKSDAPSTAARAKVWASIAGSLSGAALPAAGASSGVGVTAAKSLVTGAMLGGAITVGLAGAALLLRAGPAGAPPTGAESPGMPSHSVASGRLEFGAPSSRSEPSHGRDSEHSTPPSSGDITSAPQPAPTASQVAPPPHARVSQGRDVRAATHAAAVLDDLDREALLLASARASLARGDSDAAWRAVRNCQALPNRQLIPEEMALAAQALRGLGRVDEAQTLESVLRARYPESALAR